MIQRIRRIRVHGVPALFGRRGTIFPDLCTHIVRNLILTGQTELWKKLQLQAYEAIRPRIDVQSVLNHYDRAQTGAYIRSHLSYAGVTNEVFTEVAMDEIHQYTAGTASLIDKVCSSLLLYGCQSRFRLIDDCAVKLVLECEFS